jgi:hypothetical protein
MKRNSASTPQSFWRGLVAVLAPALIIGFFSYIYTTLDNKRKDELEFARGQIADLYGPLYTLSAALETVWDSLGRKHGNLWQDASKPPSRDQVLLWRNLLNGVVEPLNDQIDNALLSSKQTIRCPAVRDALHDFVAFAQSVKLLIGTWKSDENVTDMTRQGNMPELPYPKNLSDLLNRELMALHERESKLESGFFGLFVWGSVPECVASPKP